MEQLKVIGTEDDVLVLVTESGERFSLAVDDVLRVELRKARREREGDSPGRPPEPARHPGAHPRGTVGRRGRGAARAPASRTSRASRDPCSPSASTSSVRRSPCPCCSAPNSTRTSHPTFGGAVRAKLAEAGASGERWTSWKEPTGWIVKLEFTANRGRPRRAVGLRPAPQHPVAAERRRDPALAAGLAARGAHPAPARAGVGPREGRHALRQRRVRSAAPAGCRPRVTRPARAGRPGRAGGGDEARDRDGRHLVRDGRSARGAAAPPRPARAAARIGRSRRRPARTPPSRCSTRSSPATTRSPRDDFDDEPPTERRAGRGRRGRGRRKGRTSMPSWDEIVFGARTED